jgi:hypothetical protein
VHQGLDIVRPFPDAAIALFSSICCTWMSINTATSTLFVCALAGADRTTIDGARSRIVQSCTGAEGRGSMRTDSHE